MMRGPLLLALILLAGCQTELGLTDAPGYRVSMVALIANPDEHHGRRVRAVGTAAIGSEGSAVYLSEDDARSSALLNGLALSFSGSGVPEETKSLLNIKRVFIESVFFKPYPGNPLSGGIRDISIIYSLDDAIIEQRW